MEGGASVAATGVKIVAKNQKGVPRIFHRGKIRNRHRAFRAPRSSPSVWGNLSLKEAWCQIKDGELFIRQMHIAPYEQGNIFNKDPLRPRRLLMHKREIVRLFGKVKQDGYALVPISVYFKGSLVKVEIAPGQGQKALR